MGVFRCILEYCMPAIIKKVTHLKYQVENPINYTWPEEVSYHNPISKVRSDGYGNFWF